MFKVFLLLISATIFSTFAYSQTVVNEHDEKEISICLPQMTEAGRQSTFHFTYIYRLMADENGVIKKISPILADEKHKYLIDSDNVIPCLKKWKLSPTGIYMVTINVGTTGENSLTISNKLKSLRIFL